jgi:hypothetical protein
MECSICLSPIVAKELSKAFCGHYFHFHCIQLWTRVSPSCPNCRSAVPHLGRWELLLLLASAASGHVANRASGKQMTFTATLTHPQSLDLQMQLPFHPSPASQKTQMYLLGENLQAEDE